MNEILGRGYYHVVLERMADYVKSLAFPNVREALKYELAQMAGESMSREQLALLKAFRMYKLMLRYIASQENPVGLYMMRRITESLDVDGGSKV